MGSGAAFFDLDRTVLKGASGPLITKALQSAGLAPNRSIPGQSAIYTLFDVVGETLPAMALARGAALLSKGWAVDAVRGAGKQAADELESLVAPWARTLIDDHKAAGRPTVLATTTPYELVAPLAERLGIDDVVATRYAEDHGIYTGRLEGEFVWAAGKKSAVTAWADAHDVDLSESLRLLRQRLRRAAAVNGGSSARGQSRSSAAGGRTSCPLAGAASRRAARRSEAVRRRAARVVASVHEPAHDDGRAAVRPAPGRGHRAHPEDRSGHPRRQPPQLLRPFRVELRSRAGGPHPSLPRKKEVFDAPLVGQVVKALGNIRVDRGTGSDAPLRRRRVRCPRTRRSASFPRARSPEGVSSSTRY